MGWKEGTAGAMGQRGVTGKAAALIPTPNHTQGSRKTCRVIKLQQPHMECATQKEVGKAHRDKSINSPDPALWEGVEGPSALKSEVK